MTYDLTPETASVWTRAQRKRMAAQSRRYEAELEAAQVSAEWRQRTARRQADVTDGPLFGGRKQRGLFDE